MLDTYSDMLKKYFVIKGRVNRHDYWAGLLIMLIILSILLWFGAKIHALNFLSAIYAIAMIIPTTTATIRRLHDVCKSGWWALLALLPVVGWLCLFVYLIQDTENEEMIKEKEKKKAERKESSPRLRGGYMG